MVCSDHLADNDRIVCSVHVADHGRAVCSVAFVLQSLMTRAYRNPTGNRAEWAQHEEASTMSEGQSMYSTVGDESVPVAPSPEQPPLAPYDPPEPAPQAMDLDRRTTIGMST